jgi:hypothetical protein
MAPFQENRSRFHSLFAILIDVFHCVNQSLDVDCLLPAHLVEEWIQSAQARICAQLRFLASFAPFDLGELPGGKCCKFVVEPKVGVDDRKFSSSQ